MALQLYQGERYGTNDHGKASLSRTRFCYVLFHGSQLLMTDLAAFSPPMRSAVRLAIANELHLYVEEYLQAQRDARTLSDNTRDSRGGLVRGLGFPAVSSHKAPYSDLCKPALFCACTAPISSRTKILELVFRDHPTIKHEDMLFVIREAQVKDIKVLLESFPQGRLAFRSKADDHYRHKPIDRHEDSFGNLRQIGPLWEVARRLGNEESGEVLDLFLQRGEDINAQCGPYGMAIHSTIYNFCTARWHFDPSMLDLLTSRGADVNARGPKGNALEYVWELANTSDRIRTKYAGRWEPVIHRLLNYGAVNNRKDPNGMVPSVRRMRNFCASKSHYETATVYYKHWRHIGLARL